MSASGIPNRIGEWVTIKNCTPSFANRYICINNVSCLWGDNAASGSSKRYKPFEFPLSTTYYFIEDIISSYFTKVTFSISFAFSMHPFVKTVFEKRK